MKRRNPKERYEAWLEAEALGDERAADAALAALFVDLPLEAPSEGFAATTLARVMEGARQVAPAPAVEPVHAPAGARWAALVLGLLSAGTLGLSAAVVTLLPRLELGGAVSTFNRIVGATWEWIASGIALWGRAAEWSELLARVVAVPGIAGSLVVTAATAVLALSLLRRILQHDVHEKEVSYVRHH